MSAQHNNPLTLLSRYEGLAPRALPRRCGETLVHPMSSARDTFVQGEQDVIERRHRGRTADSFDYEHRDFDGLILGAAADWDPLFPEELGTNIIEETIDL
ncbi:hypothetical protein [Nocardia sp. NPDC059239]|uniref:hypothetical protein n=1 Tax=unclassified Nocardia TaxID=2637762 RepID=UPI00367BEA4A